MEFQIWQTELNVVEAVSNAIISIYSFILTLHDDIYHSF